MNYLDHACMTLPNGATRTGREILEALERCRAWESSQLVTGWSCEPMTAAAAVVALEDALEMLERASTLTLNTYTPEELDAEKNRAQRREQKARAEERIREPLTARSVACQGVFFPDDETLFSGPAEARRSKA